MTYIGHLQLDIMFLQHDRQFNVKKIRISLFNLLTYNSLDCLKQLPFTDLDYPCFFIVLSYTHKKKFWVVYRYPYVHLFACQFVHSSFHPSPSLIK